jgi:hypothetical protein
MKGPSKGGMERVAKFFKVSAESLEDFKRRRIRKVSEES